MTEEIIEEALETGAMTQEELGHGPVVEVLEPADITYSFEEYTQDISEDLVVTTYGDGKVLDKSGPFDTRENAEAFGASLIDGFSSGDIKPNHAFIQG